MPAREKKTDKPAKKIDAAETERRQIPLVLNLMNRVLIKLSERDAMKKAGIGVAEWSVLNEIAQNADRTRAGRIAKRLDVAPQRINAVMKSLKELEYVSVTRSEKDPRARDLAVTELGRKHAAAVEAEIRSLFASAFKEKPAQLTHLRAGLKRVADQMPTEKAIGQQAAERE